MGRQSGIKAFGFGMLLIPWGAPDFGVLNHDLNPALNRNPSGDYDYDYDYEGIAWSWGRSQIVRVSSRRLLRELKRAAGGLSDYNCYKSRVKGWNSRTSAREFCIGDRIFILPTQFIGFYLFFTLAHGVLKIQVEQRSTKRLWRENYTFLSRTAAGRQMRVRPRRLSGWGAIILTTLFWAITSPECWGWGIRLPEGVFRPGFITRRWLTARPRVGPADLTESLGGGGKPSGRLRA